MNTPVREGETIEGSRTMRNRPYPVLKCSSVCGRLLVALVESVLRPGGWENMCRLMCHCVRHVSLDNKYGRSVKAIHSSRSRWRDGTESVPAHRKSRRQEELDGERESPKVLTEVSEVRLDAVSSPQV